MVEVVRFPLEAQVIPTVVIGGVATTGGDVIMLVDCGGGTLWMGDTNKELGGDAIDGGGRRCYKVSLLLDLV